MRVSTIRLLALLVAGTLPASCHLVDDIGTALPHADLILFGGVVWTADPARPRAEAVAVLGERLLVVGDDEEVLRHRGPATRLVDLDGQLVVPGFCDNHVRLSAATRFLETGLLDGAGVAENHPPHLPRELSHERRLARTRHALAELARHGVTSISDVSDDAQLEIYRELRARGELTARIEFRYPLDRWPELAAQGIRSGGGDEWIRLGALKGHVDGIMGTSSARFFEPYRTDPGNRGRWRRLLVDERGRFVEGQLLQYMLDADRAGLQLSIHAIGDEANQLVLDSLEELERRNGSRDRRFRLVHAQVLAWEDLARLGELDVIAEVQPYHLSDDMRWMEQRIGRQRCEGAYAFRRIQQSGALLSFGTDWPGTSAAEYPIDPLLGLYAAVTRQTVRGEPARGWFPAERISIEDALRAATLHGAYATWDEELKGSLEPGKLADLAVLDRNLLEVPPAKILETRVVLTMVGGEIVFERS